MAFNKYGAKKTVIDGIKFDSIAESERYSELLILQKAGEIKDLQLQPKFELQESFEYEGKTERAITYIADFMYYKPDIKCVVVEDVKSKITAKEKSYRIKRKMFLYRYGDSYLFNEVIQ